MAQHNEGPWSLDPLEECNDHTGETRLLGVFTGFYSDIIATVHCTDLPEGRANARLMVAAPDLLAALCGLVGKSTDTTGDWSREWDAALAAIAKATGAAE